MVTNEKWPERLVGFPGRVVLSVLFVSVTAVLVYLFIELFPDGGEAKAFSKSLLWGWRWTLSADELILVLVVLGGVIGGEVKSLLMLRKYMGQRNLKWSWVLSYFGYPCTGAVLAVTFYLIIRAGFVSFDKSNLNVYGYTALALLTGLFADKVMGRLGKVSDGLFSVEAKTEGKPGGDPEDES